MDAFTWIIIAALGACLFMHVFGHKHGHRAGDEHEARSNAQGRGGVAGERPVEHVSQSKNATEVLGTRRYHATHSQ